MNIRGIMKTAHRQARPDQNNPSDSLPWVFNRQHVVPPSPCEGGVGLICNHLPICNHLYICNHREAVSDTPQARSKLWPAVTLKQRHETRDHGVKRHYSRGEADIYTSRASTANCETNVASADSSEGNGCKAGRMRTSCLWGWFYNKLSCVLSSIVRPQPLCFPVRKKEGSILYSSRPA